MRVLVVEDDGELRRAIARTLEDWGAEVLHAADVEQGVAALSHCPDLLIVDVRLGTGTGVRVVEVAAASRPAPLVMAVSGEASPAEAFRLAQLGVAVFLPKPLSLDSLLAALERVLSEPGDLSSHVAVRVGLEGYHDLLRRVRRTMLEQALARSGGNRQQAAKLLGISRQAVQQLIRDLELEVAG